MKPIQLLLKLCTALQLRASRCTGVSWRPAGATLVWLHHALASLDADLRSRHGPGAGIVYRHGPYATALTAIAEAAAAGVVHLSRRYEPAMQARRPADNCIGNVAASIPSCSCSKCLVSSQAQYHDEPLALTHDSRLFGSIQQLH